MIRLIPVDPDDYGHLNALYRLLSERKPWQSISHRKMPTFPEHCAFVQSKPYHAWYMIVTDDGLGPRSGMFVGATYLTRQKEIGIFVFDGYQGMGIGSTAVRMLMAQHEGPFLANVNPKNGASQSLFDSLGGKLIQVTYELESHTPDRG